MEIRGDDSLRFQDWEIAWDDPAMGRQQLRAADPNGPPAGIIFLSIVLVSAIVLGLAGMASHRQVAAKAARHNVEQLSRQHQPADVGAAFRKSSKSDAPIKPPPKYVLNLRALDGQTYRIESRTGFDIQNKLPPGFGFGYAASELPLWEAPDGRFLGPIPKGTRFLYTTLVYQTPCWRWLVTLDGQHQGYFCPANPGPNPELVYSISEVTTPPTVLSKVEPEYSDTARIAKFQGTVVLRVEITATGTVRNIRVVQPLGLGLDEKAAEAISQWRFTPAYKDGEPVAVWAMIEVSFKLV